jgi:hypothetical protein
VENGKHSKRFFRSFSSFGGEKMFGAAIEICRFQGFVYGRRKNGVLVTDKLCKLVLGV